MAFERISDSRMYDEIMEVLEHLRLNDRAIEFLEDIEGRARDDELTDKQREWLEDIYQKACDCGH